MFGSRSAIATARSALVGSPTAPITTMRPTPAAGVLGIELEELASGEDLGLVRCRLAGDRLRELLGGAQVAEGTHRVPRASLVGEEAGKHAAAAAVAELGQCVRDLESRAGVGVI